MTEPVKIVIVICDGEIEVRTAGVPVSYVVVDHDFDGPLDLNLGMAVIPGDDVGEEVEVALGSDQLADASPPAMAWVLAIHELAGEVAK